MAKKIIKAPSAKTLFEIECDKLVTEVQNLLGLNTEWIKRFDDYADKINLNIAKIKGNKKQFREWSPLKLYMNVSQAKSGGVFSLRYLGQDVAKLTVKGKVVEISNDNYFNTNKRDFGCSVLLKNDPWNSEKAINFRKHFSFHPNRKKRKNNKGNEEHKIESILLSEFSKRKKKEKFLPNIQPVKLADVVRFQMPTPLSASDISKIKYSNSSGGGIDILSRIKTKGVTKLCIMEVKDESVSNEPPAKTIKQSLAYTTFISELLRSKRGDKWWKIFGFNGKLPKKLDLLAFCVMPSSAINDYSFNNKIIKSKTDNFHLHYMYFETQNSISKIDTQL